jgi:hypothetical protein
LTRGGRREWWVGESVGRFRGVGGGRWSIRTLRWSIGAATHWRREQVVVVVVVVVTGASSELGGFEVPDCGETAAIWWFASRAVLHASWSTGQGRGWLDGWVGACAETPAQAWQGYVCRINAASPMPMPMRLELLSRDERHELDDPSLRPSTLVPLPQIVVV